MVAAAHADPADAIVAGEVDRFLDGTSDDEAAETVVAIDDGGGAGLPDDPDLRRDIEPAHLDPADVLREAEDPVPVGAGKIGGSHQFGRALRIRPGDAGSAIGRRYEVRQLRPGDARRRRIFPGHGSSADSAAKTRRPPLSAP